MQFSTPRATITVIPSNAVMLFWWNVCTETLSLMVSIRSSTHQLRTRRSSPSSSQAGTSQLLATSSENGSVVSVVFTRTSHYKGCLHKMHIRELANDSLGVALRHHCVGWKKIKAVLEFRSNSNFFFFFFNLTQWPAGRARSIWAVTTRVVPDNDWKHHQSSALLPTYNNAVIPLCCYRKKKTKKTNESSQLSFLFCMCQWKSVHWFEHCLLHFICIC